MLARRRCAVALFAALSPVATTLAATEYWVGASGDSWSNAFDWSSTFGGGGGSASVPVAGDTVYLTSGTSKVVLFAGPNYTSSLATLTVDGTSTAAVTLSQSGAIMSAGTEYIGRTGLGAYQQNAGSNSLANLFLGNSAGSTGSYTLLGSAVLNTNTSYVGFNGSGTFTQASGTHTVTYNLNLAYDPGSSGFYMLNLGSLTVGSNELLGDDQNTAATFSQSAGSTNSAAAVIMSGVSSTATSYYNLNGGALNAPTQTVGLYGSATFTQSGGTNTATTLNLGFNAGSNGVYTFTGGTFTATTVNVSPTGHLNLNYGYPGFHFATLNQTGGTVTSSTGNFFFDPSASYNLSAGTLNAAGLFLNGDSSTMTQTGGTNTVAGQLAIGYWGNANRSYYRLNAGTVSAGEIDAFSTAASPGEFDQEGGSVSVGTINVAYGSGTSGYYMLNGGTLSASAENIAYPSGGTAQMYQQAGINTVGNLSIGTGGAYQINTGTLAITGRAYNYGTFLNSATVTGTFENHGTFTSVSGAVLAGTILNYGTINPQNTNLIPSVAFYNYAPITLTAGNGIGSDGATGLVNNDSIYLSGGSTVGAGPLVNNGLVSGFGTLGGTGGINNYGTISPNGGLLTLANSGANTNNGTISVTAPYQFVINSSLTNAGTIQLNSAQVSGTGGGLVNAAAGTIVGPGTIATGIFSNYGLVLAPAGTTRINAPFTNSGILQLTDPAANLTGATVTSAGTIQGQGKLALTLTNNGTVEALGGTLIVASALTNNASGLLAASTGNKLLITGAFTSNAGTIDPTGGTIDTNGQTLTNNGIITGFGTLRTGSLTNNASITLTGGMSTINGPVTNNASRIIEARYNPVLFTGNVTNNGVLKVTSTNVTFAASYAGSPPSEPVLSPSLSLPTPGGLDGSGTVSVDGAGSLTASYLRQASLTSAGPVALRPASQGGDTSVLSLLDLGATGSLDLADNRLILNYPASSPIAGVRQYLHAGQILSSVAQADSLHRQVIGYAEASQLGVTSWGGQSVTGPAVVTKLTWLGDANLDGVVNADDYALLDRGFAAYRSGAVPAGSATWTTGDFNYDGVVDQNDYLLIDRVSLQQSGTLDPALLAQRESQFGPAYVAALTAAVPEPSALAALILCPGLLCRRRTRRP